MATLLAYDVFQAVANNDVIQIPTGGKARAILFRFLSGGNPLCPAYEKDSAANKYLKLQLDPNGTKVDLPSFPIAPSRQFIKLPNGDSGGKDLKVTFDAAIGTLEMKVTNILPPWETFPEEFTWYYIEELIK